MKYNRICQIRVSKNLLYKAHCLAYRCKTGCSRKQRRWFGCAWPKCGLNSETAVSTPEETAGKMREEIRKPKNLPKNHSG